MTPDLGSLQIRPIGRTELDAAIDLVAGSMHEIPLFEWLLGPHIDDAEVRRWLAGFFVARHVPLGRVEGAITVRGEVLGIVVWTAPDNPSPPLTPSIEETTARILPSRPDIVERLQTMATHATEHDSFDACVDLSLIVTAPSLRGSGFAGRIGLRAQQAAIDGGYGITMMTTSLPVADSHQRLYGAKREETYSLGTVTVYRCRMTPEQVRDWRPLTSST